MVSYPHLFAAPTQYTLRACFFSTVVLMHPYTPLVDLVSRMHMKRTEEKHGMIAGKLL
jgi:hypothetical protein